MSATHPIPHDERDERPKALRYKDKTDAIETMILDALPKIVGKLIAMAEDGDVRASRYLVDRIFGRTARIPLPPNADKALPYKNADWTLSMLRHKDDRDTRTRAHMRSILKAEAREAEAERAGSTIPGIGSTVDGNPTLDAIREDLARWQSNGGKPKPSAA